jgi:kinesin family protein 20
MIVNVNPFETGFDENSHVMKFSAVAKEIMTVKNTTPALPIASVSLPAKSPRVVRLSMIDGGEEQDIIYEGTSLSCISRTSLTICRNNNRTRCGGR